MEVTCTTTFDIDLDSIAAILADTLYDVLNSDYRLNAEIIYKIYPQISDELSKKIREQLEP